MPENPDNRAPAGRRTVSAAGFWNGWFLAVAALAFCWIMFFSELRGEWSVNPQYNYGYAVPLLGLMLFWRRWTDRPDPRPGPSCLTVVVAGTSLLLLLPLSLVREANPEWRLVYWSHGILVLILTFSFLYHAGGWRWIRYFAPPLVFMLIAVPWPMELESAVIQNLMRLVAALTVEVAGWLGIPAVQHGNLIEVTTGVVGIDEACSGVRSLQSALMLSLFLGELYCFRPGRRVFLVAASLACVLLANVIRTSFLTWLAAKRGIQQMEAWHDSAGMLVMVIVLPSLIGLAHGMKPKIMKSPAAPTHAGLPPRAISHWIALGAFLWIGFTLAATEIWYRSHEKNLISNSRWTVAWPVQESHFQKTAVPAESLAILRCSQSDSAMWEDQAGNQWNAFFLHWNAGRNSTQLAKGHRPDICFPAAGAKLVQDSGQITVKANGIDLPFKYQIFQGGSRLLHVFYCLWSDRVSGSGKPEMEDGSWISRMQAVREGRRNPGQQVLEVVVSGPETGDEAVSLFEQQLPHLVSRE